MEKVVHLDVPKHRTVHELAAAAGEAVAERGPLLSKPYRKQDLGRAVRAVLDG